MPTYTEWFNVDNSGAWTTWNGPWASELKLHAAGFLHYTSGSLINRGVDGVAWSSMQSSSTNGFNLVFWVANSFLNGDHKENGFGIRCLLENCTTPSSPTQGSNSSFPTEIIWNWNTVTGATGYKWNTTDNYATATNMGAATTKTETGLTCGTAYMRYVWAYNGCGYSLTDTLTQTTDDCLVLPTVTTTAITGITSTSATGGGNVTSDGGAAVTARGVCWSTSSNPTISGNKTTDGSGMGIFTSSLTGLAPNTLYYVRAYATNSLGTAYGDPVTFSNIAFAVGQSYGGGVIFWLDSTGVHGLISATSDQNYGRWGCEGVYIGGTSTAIGTGQANTTAIVNVCTQEGAAARICNDLVLNGYDDWFLPSKDELIQMYIQRAVIGGFGNNIYWCSKEYDPSMAWAMNFALGTLYWFPKDYYYNYWYVRAIRAF
jgi:hypothetical protein